MCTEINFDAQINLVKTLFWMNKKKLFHSIKREKKNTFSKISYWKREEEEALRETRASWETHREREEEEKKTIEWTNWKLTGTQTLASSSYTQTHMYPHTLRTYKYEYIVYECVHRHNQTVYAMERGDTAL